MDQDSPTPAGWQPQPQPQPTEPPKHSKLKKALIIIGSVLGVIILSLAALLLYSTKNQWLPKNGGGTATETPSQEQQVDPKNGHLGANIKILAPSPAFLATYSALIDPERPEYFQYSSPDRMCVLAFGLLGGSDPNIKIDTIMESVKKKNEEVGSKLLDYRDIDPVVLQDSEDSSKTYIFPGKRLIYEDEGIQTITHLNIGIRKDGRRVGLSRVCEADPGKSITVESLSQLEEGVRQMKVQRLN